LEQVFGAFLIWTGFKILYISNIFAILGPRPPFFFLAGMMDRFHSLPVGPGLVPALVG